MLFIPLPWGFGLHGFSPPPVAQDVTCRPDSDVAGFERTGEAADPAVKEAAVAERNCFVEGMRCCTGCAEPLLRETGLQA